MIRAIATVALLAALAGCSSAHLVERDDSSRQPKSAPSATASAEQPRAPECITVSATWVDHIQAFMEDGYTVTRAAAAHGSDGYVSIAVLYTSPANEEILGSWGTGGDPASESVMQVFPLDEVTASHTVVMMPRTDIVAAGLAGAANATTRLG